MENVGILDVDCPEADQIGEMRAHLRQAEFLMNILEMRMRSAAYERQRKAAQRARKHPIETNRPDAGTSERLAG